MGGRGLGGWDEQMQVFRRFQSAILVICLVCVAVPAWSQAPVNWQLSFQAPHSPVQEAVEGLHAMVLWLMAVVTVFVAALLGFVMWRYNAAKNPVASQVSHHTALEVAWTVLPVLILVVIAIPSFRLIYYEDKTDDPAMTIKVTGRQWAWEYSYPDQGGINFISNMIADEELKPGDIRRLSVDNRLVLPAGKNIRILTTSNDVIHSFFIPSLGVQRYAIPGRIIETWVRVNQPGVFYGQCNQICGANHDAMPIAVEAMTEQNFAAWVVQAKTKFAASDAVPAHAAGPQLAAVADTQR